MGNCIAPSSSSGKSGRSVGQPKTQVSEVESKSEKPQSEESKANEYVRRHYGGPQEYYYIGSDGQIYWNNFKIEQKIGNGLYNSSDCAQLEVIGKKVFTRSTDGRIWQWRYGVPGEWKQLGEGDCA